VDSVKSREQFSNTAKSMKEDYTYCLHLCKTSAVFQKLYNTDRAAKLYFVKTHFCGYMMEKLRPKSVCSAVQSGFKPVDM